MKKRVYITRLIPESGIRLLRETYHVEILSENKPPDRDLLLKKISDCDGLVSLLSDKIDDEVLGRADQLKIVANYAVGYDNIDIEAAKRLNIMVTNTPGVLTNATAEIAFAMLIVSTRRIIEADRFTREGRFKGWDPMLFQGDELKGKTLGIIGLGRIGQDMSLKCKAFGMKTLYYNRRPVDHETERRLSATYTPLDELLEQSDVISIHTPLTEKTYHLMNPETFSRMKEGSYLINTSRGEVVDEKALVLALKSGKIRGAGLDVYEFEPEITHELLGMNNVVLLPHIGSATKETRNRMSEMAARNVIAALEGEKPGNLVPELEPVNHPLER
jgi:glyoxylate reductase